MQEKIKSCCFTGYRPSKLPFPMNEEHPDFVNLENKLIDAVLTLADEGYLKFYCGMAMGFDIIAANIVLVLKKAYKKAPISLVCAVPFKKQSESFYKNWKKKYDEILSGADEVVYISEEYTQGVYQKRNEFMVDNSDCVITWFNGISGGTKNTLRYAKKKNKKVINLYERNAKDYFNEPDYEVVSLDI